MRSPRDWGKTRNIYLILRQEMELSCMGWRIGCSMHTKKRRHKANKGNMIYINVWPSINMWPCVYQVYNFVQLGLNQNMYTFLLYYKCITALLCLFRFAVFSIKITRSSWNVEWYFGRFKILLAEPWIWKLTEN